MSASESTAFVLDETGREIMQGDVLRVEHFTTRHGRGHRMHYMYKWVMQVVTLGTEPKTCPALKVSHLGRVIDKGCYYYLMDGRMLKGVRIIQGFGPNDKMGFGTAPFDERPKKKPSR